MYSVISFGETLVDLLSNRISNAIDNKHGGNPSNPVSSDSQSEDVEQFSAFAGGAPANVAASIARLGGLSLFVGKVGDDMFGDFLESSLKNMGVDTRGLLKAVEYQTPLAFVSLDSEGERRFQFYRKGSADLHFEIYDFNPECFKHAGIFHFCSNTLTEPHIEQVTIEGIRLAQEADLLISFGVNLRINLWEKPYEACPVIMRNLEQADIVKMSREELEFLTRYKSEHQLISDMLAAGVSLVIVTDAGNPLSYYTVNGAGKLTPPVVTMVDSTAAGDAFVGGLLQSIAEREIDKNDFAKFLCSDQLNSVIQFASACGAYAATLKGAFPSLPSRSQVEALLENH